MAPPTTLPHSSAQTEIFTRAVDLLRSTRPRPEISLSEINAPTKLAPEAFALSGEVLRDGEEVATGHLVLLHDPAGHPAWGGMMRLVTYITAEIESELAADPLLAQVGWSWLVDALDAYETGYSAIGGTVTQTLSTRFGDLSGPPTAADLEIRASWTPLGENFDDHLMAWCALLASTAGLPPPGVTALPVNK